jgi:hypothetical protein
MELFFKILLQFLAISLILITSLMDYKWSDKRTKKFKKGRRFLIGLTFIFLIGSIIWTWFDYNENRKVEQRYFKQFIALNDSLSDIKNISVLLTNQIAPFLKLAEENYPTLPSEEALEKLQSDINNLETKTNELTKKENGRLEAEKSLTILKNTPPAIDANLYIDKNLKELVLAIEFKNKVPINFHYVIKELNNTVIGGVMIGQIELHPKEGIQFHIKSHGKISSFKIPQDVPTEIIFEFIYSSIYQAELSDKNLSGKIIKRYQINPAKDELLRIK